MRSRFYVGKVMHARTTPVQHRFVYPIYMCVIDPDELPDLDGRVRGFGHNRFNLVSVYDRDHLRGEGSIRQRLMPFLEQCGCDGDIARIEMVTMARFMGYCFNPVRFYYCYSRDESPRCIAAEVNNTFGERHLYILDNPLGGLSEYPLRYRHTKQFHVSPFNDMNGHYDFHFSELGDTMRIGVTLVRGEDEVLAAWLTGRAVPLDSANLRRIALRYPLTAALTFPRISVHAARLHYGRKLPIYHKPYPSSPMTIGVNGPSTFQAWCMRPVLRVLERIRTGRLSVALPDGSVRTFGRGGGREAVVKVHDYDFFRRVAMQGDIGFGESFTAGEWSSDDLTGLLRLFIDMLKDSGSREQGRLSERWRDALRRNTPRGSRRNIRAHYDLGNDFYSLFLDKETMLYSAAVFESDADSLGDAQLNKIRRIIKMAELEASDRVLEIGCGWGGFAVEAARRTGCRVTAVTISDEQFKLARQRVEDEGLSDRIDVRLCDYRRVEGRYDKIVSIEMLEAVGHQYFALFFRRCDALLKPGGRAVIQVITIPDERYDAYRRRPDWIRKHVFPGGLLPSPAIIRRAVEASTNLRIVREDSIGLHYVRTLKAWRDALLANGEKLKAMGYGDEFRRKWQYYFCYCEAGFAEKYIDDLQIVLAKPAGAALPGSESGE